jgi:hypothetical protein
MSAKVDVDALLGDGSEPDEGTLTIWKWRATLGGGGVSIQ